MPFTLTLDKLYSSRFFLYPSFPLLTGNDFKRSIRYYMHNESAKLAVRYNRLHFYLRPQSYTMSWVPGRSAKMVHASYLISLVDINKVTWLMHNRSLFFTPSLSQRSFYSSPSRSVMFSILMVCPIHYYALCRFAII